MKTLIKLEHINYSYNKDVNALNDVSLDIYEGEDLAIIGHNGSGKSTLAKIIISLLKPNQGNLYFNNEIINEKNDNIIRSKSGIVFQNPDNQFVGVTVKDDIAFGLENRCVKQEDMQAIIDKYAKETGVYELLNKEPANLSGGQKQRVAIAGILAMLPDVVVFDEALAMLDPLGKKEISELINKIKRENKHLTIVRITHDLDEAFNSDRVVVLNKGCIEMIDTPINVFKNIDKLNELKLDVPFIVKVNDRLKKEGLIDQEIFDFDLLVNKLCK